MNKVSLDKLNEYCLITFKNTYNNNIKMVNLEDEINKMRQNISLNEKNLLLRCNFIEFKSVYVNSNYNEKILINPISFNIEIEEMREFYNFVNGLLLVLNNDYMESNIINKKKILETAINIYRENLNNFTDFNNIIINKIAEKSNINIIIVNIKDNNIQTKLYANTTNKTDKYIVLLNYDNDYLPFINFDRNYYLFSFNFIQYLLSFKIDFKIPEYNEVNTVEDHALYLTEKDENIKTTTIQSNHKIKNKKDIFIKKDNLQLTPDNNNKEIKPEINVNSDIKEKQRLQNEVKKNIIKTLEELQEISNKLGVNIEDGKYKNGNIKYKTKNILIKEILELNFE
jgi:hypothetical protein